MITPPEDLRPSIPGSRLPAGAPCSPARGSEPPPRRREHSNFGFNLPWWDRAFGTCRAQPADGQDAMEIGIMQFRDPGELRIDRMLLQPFPSPE
jgi:hypothetical protein